MEQKYFSNYNPGCIGSSNAVWKTKVVQLNMFYSKVGTEELTINLSMVLNYMWIGTIQK